MNDIEKLIERAKTGETDALKMLYEKYAPKMRGICISITKEDKETVDDLVQESFILAYYSLDKLNESSKFGEWLSTITRNVSLRHLKRRRRFLSLSKLKEEELDVAETASAESLLSQEEIMQLVDNLPAGYSKVFRMSVIEGYSHKEIAAKLGIEPHSSSSQLARAKALLREMINKRSLTILSLILVSIPLFKHLLWHRETEEFKYPAATSRESLSMPQKKLMETRSRVTYTVPEKSATTSAKSSLPPHGLSQDSTVDIGRQQASDTTKSVALTVPDSTYSYPDTARVLATIADDRLMAETTRSRSNGWQLLASGSLGSALAQTAYKLMKGSNSGLPDIDAPIGPTTFSTWEDYYAYLQTKKLSGQTADTLALMTIAKHNSGKIAERESHDRPVTWGFSLMKDLGGRWSLETGLQYSLLKSQFTLGEDSYYIRKTQKVHYLGLPLRASYKWVDRKFWTIYSSAGLLMNIPLYGKANEQYVTGTTVPYKDNWHFTPPFQWSVGAGIGLQLRFLPHWSLYMEPTVNWFIPNGSSVHTIWTEHPFSVTMPFGLRFNW